MPTLSSIRTSIENSNSLVLDEHVKNGIFCKNKHGRVMVYAGGFSVAYPYVNKGEKWAFRCWHADLGNMRGHFMKLSQALAKLQLPYFCNFNYVDEGIIVEGKKYPTTRMRWIEGKNLKEYICTYRNDKEKLKNLASNFVKMVTTLHDHHISHGDLQHGNILIDAKDDIYLIDYDSVYVPELDGEFDIIKGLKGYQHPKRSENKMANEKVDYFSELIIYLSILAISENPSLVEKYQIEDSEQLLFSIDDFKDIEHSLVYSDLMQQGGVFPILLKILVDYLKEDDINNLTPFHMLLEQYMKVPKILSFKPSSNELVVNQSYRLTWNVENASKVYLNGELQTSGVCEYVFKPSHIGKYKYELKVENGLETASKILELHVSADVVINISCEPDKLRKGKGEFTTLYWDILNAKSAQLFIGTNSETIPLKGQRKESPQISTTYTIKAIALDGTTKVEKSVTVGVFSESEVVFKSDKAFAYKDVPVTLSWDVKNAIEVKLDGIKVPSAGSKVVTTDIEKKFWLEVTDNFVTKRVPITVKTIPLPMVKTVLLPMPKMEEKIVFQQRIPSPKVQVITNMQGLNVKLRDLDVDLKPSKFNLRKLKPLHPLSIKVGSSLRTRLKTAINIITNNIEYLKFESDGK